MASIISPVSSPNVKTFHQKLFARIRVAIESDVPHIYKLVQHLYAHHSIAHLLKSTESSIALGLFNPINARVSPVKTLLVEVSANPFPPDRDQAAGSNVREIDLNLPLIDEESEEFRVVNDDDVFIAGYVMFYPCFSSFFEKPVLHIENNFIRECYRRKGFGKWMFSTMASEAATMGFSSIDWYASNSNQKALEFYKKMGATISGDFKVLSLTGKALEAFHEEDHNN